MKNSTGKRSLERYAIFPYVAWGLIAGFALFVYDLANTLEENSTLLQERTTELHTKIQKDPQMVDFDGEHDVSHKEHDQ